MTRVVAVAIVLWLTLIGFLLGRVAERMWFDEARSALLRQLEDDERRIHTHLIHLEVDTTKR